MSKLEKNLNIDSIEKIDNADRNSDIKIEEHLSDDFKNNLVKMMTEEYEKDEKESIKEDSKTNKLKRLFYKNNNNYKNRRSYSFPKRLAILFTLFIIVSGVTFGKNFTSLVAKIFSNQDKSVDLSIENGYYQNIDMDYIFHDGVGIKVDYVYADESCIYIAFNVESEEEFKWIYLQDMTITNENSEVIYSLAQKRVSYQAALKRISKNNTIILAKFYSINQDFIDYSKLNIDILQVVLVKDDDNEKSIFNKWYYELAVEKAKTDTEILYAVNSENMIKNYNIKQKNNILSIDIIFNDSLIDKLDINRNNIYIEDDEGNFYYFNDYYIFNNNNIKMNFPIKISNSKKLKFVFRNNEEKTLIFYLYRKDG